MQVLYPWRRIFQQMFNHDRMAGALYCMRESDMRSNHAVITQLGARCRAAFDDYAAVQSLLISTLDMQVSLSCTLAVLPARKGPRLLRKPAVAGCSTLDTCVSQESLALPTPPPPPPPSPTSLFTPLSRGFSPPALALPSLHKRSRA